MRLLAIALALAVAACGGATAVPDPSATTASGTIAPGATVTGTAITVTIVPGTLPPNPTKAPSPTPSPAPGGLTQAALKYRIVARFGPLAFCDPDYYPVARADEETLAHDRLPDIQKDGPTFSAIVSYLSITTNPPYTADQELAIYRSWKMLSALRLDPVSAGFHFAGVFIGFGSPSTPRERRVDGTVDQMGAITVASEGPGVRPPCPICLARGTRIATPSGDVAVEDLELGDTVWTRDFSGARVAAPLVAIGNTPVPAMHRVVALLLSDGRFVEVSPGHPTADGRTVGDLRAGDAYDGALVVNARLVAYSGGATFDVLPAGATGTYWANGVLLGSTLR